MTFFLLALLAAPAFAQSIQNTTLHPNFNNNKCLDVRGNIRSDGTAVDIFDCNGTGAQNWTVITGTGPTKVQLAGTNFCLDAGSNAGNGVGMKIWTCFNNLPAQQWFYTDDNRIALENQGLCLDLTNGVLANGNQVQTWQCTNNDNNQVWTRTGTTPPPPPTSTSVVLHPNGNNNKCVDVRGDVEANGTPVQIYDCNGTPAQNWVITKGSTKVQLNGTNFCLDAGASPSNGIGAKIWTCFDNLPAQQWFYTGDNRISLEGQGFCLDLTNGVLDNGNQLQEWQCTNNNNNQVWTE